MAQAMNFRQNISSTYNMMYQQQQQQPMQP
jgi:hypothetical protein